MSNSLLFSELEALKTPRSTNQAPSLTTDAALSICGRLAEGLMLNDTLTVPLRGPALEIPVLIKLFGYKGFRELLDAGILRFLFCPGVIAYVSERNRRQGVKAGPGIVQDEWGDKLFGAWTPKVFIDKNLRRPDDDLAT